jgi:hypothetical protein
MMTNRLVVRAVRPCMRDFGPGGFAPVGPSFEQQIGGLSVNIPIMVPMRCATECLPSAPGAIILERGTDHVMATLRDQEGRQSATLGGPLRSSPRTSATRPARYRLTGGLPWGVGNVLAHPAT